MARNAAEFDEFYRATSRRVLRYGYAVTGDLTEAQDVVQEAYTRAWRDWRHVERHPSPEAWVRLVVTRPFPPDSPQSLRRALGERVEVTLLDEVSIVVTGPADAHSLAIVSRWCEENDVLPESLTLGQRTLEDVFLELTGRQMTA